MKKGFALLLALTMALALTATAFAAGELPYADVSEDAPYAQAVQGLYDAQIMVGSAGQFNPNDTITRREFAAVVCRLLDMEDEAAAITDSSFTDVDGGKWYTGCITLAAQLKIVNGYGDGRFGPKDPVTVEQAAKMLVCAWGYESQAIAAGGWPAGYVSVARELGILDGVAETGNVPAKRSVVAMMAYQTMMSPTADEQGGYAE